MTNRDILFDNMSLSRPKGCCQQRTRISRLLTAIQNNGACKAMVLEPLRQYAEKLERALMKYKKDNEAGALADSLRDLVERAKQGSIKEPIDYGKVPGSYFFNEGRLRQYPDLEEAYAEFKLEVTGGETEEAKKALDMIAQFQKKTSE